MIFILIGALVTALGHALWGVQSLIQGNWLGVVTSFAFAALSAWMGYSAWQWAIGG